MLQFLVMLVEWVALAALALLGVKYETAAPCPTLPTVEYQTVHYTASAADLMQPAALGSECISDTAKAPAVYLIET